MSFVYKDNQGNSYKLEEIPQIVEALKELVVLKSIKDHEGLTTDYMRRKPLAWARARELLNMCPHGKNLNDYCQLCGRIHNAS